MTEIKITPTKFTNLKTGEESFGARLSGDGDDFDYFDGLDKLRQAAKTPRQWLKWCLACVMGNWMPAHAMFEDVLKRKGRVCVAGEYLSKLETLALIRRRLKRLEESI